MIEARKWPALAELVGPNDLQLLLNDRWERACCRFLHGVTDTGSLLNSRDLETILAWLSSLDSRQNKSSARIRLSKDGHALPPAQWCRPNGTPILSAIHSAVAAGAAIHVADVHLLWPALHDFAERLSNEFGYDVRIDVNLIPARSAGQSCHDTTDNHFILPLEGECSVASCEPGEDSHALFDADMPRSDRDPLRPGNVCYVPRGGGYQARATTDACLLLAVALCTLTWEDAVRYTISRIARYDSAFRESITGLSPEQSQTAFDALLQRMIAKADFEGVCDWSASRDRLVRT